MSLLALLLQSDVTEQQQRAATALAGLGIGFFAIIFLVILAVFCFIIFLFWRILVKAGMAGPLSLLALPFIPFGALIVLCILAFGEWKVVPVQQAYAPPPLPPNYPPQNLPPSNYPPQQGY